LACITNHYLHNTYVIRQERIVPDQDGETRLDRSHRAAQAPREGGYCLTLDQIGLRTSNALDGRGTPTRVWSSHPTEARVVRPRAGPETGWVSGPTIAAAPVTSG
jgi:hypothetical protein